MKYKVNTTGFTLIEMMVAITIAGILLAVAVPSFKDFITRNAIENIQSRFAAAVTAARSEAASRNTVITLCSSTDGENCATVNNKWISGWIVFVDTDADAIVDAPAEEILQVFKSAGTYKVGFKDDNNTQQKSISFTSQGFVRNDMRAYAAFCSPTASESQFTRGLTIERSGRVMKAQTKTTAFDPGTASLETFELTCP